MSKETESKVNEYQAALNTLKPNDRDVIQHEDGWWNWQNAAIISIQELVNIYPEYLELKEKATPKKPIKRVLKRFEGDRCIVDVCPNCDSELYYGQSCSNNKCRQAIDWSKDEKREK